MERRGKSSRIVILIFFAIFSTWSALQFLAPLSLPQSSIDDLSGLTAISDNEIIISEMTVPWNIIYSVGDRLCHQKAERSFSINENQMPFCSRCTAIWLGLAIGLGFMVFYRIQLNEKFLFVVIGGLVPIGIDGIGQLFGFWESTNIMRVTTGLIIGVCCGISIGIIIDEIKTFIPFKKTKSN